MSGSNKGQGQGAVGNIQRLSKLGRRRAGTEDKPPSSDQALIASIFLPSNEGGVPEAQAPGPTDETAGFEALSDLNPPPHEESGPSPVRTVEKTPAPGASEPVPEEPDKTRRPSRKAVIAAVVILVLTAAAFMRSCGDATDKKPVATKPADVPAPWVRLESNEVKPLNTILPGPEAAVGVDREKQIPRMLENLNKPEKPSIPTVGPAAPAAKAEPENTERTHELDAKVASLTQELNALKAQKAERPQVKKAAAPRDGTCDQDTGGCPHREMPLLPVARLARRRRENTPSRIGRQDQGLHRGCFYRPCRSLPWQGESDVLHHHGALIACAHLPHEKTEKTTRASLRPPWAFTWSSSIIVIFITILTAVCRWYWGCPLSCNTTARPVFRRRS